MNQTQQREAARQFFYRWKDRGREDEDARSYWIELLEQVFGAARMTERLVFEKKVIGRDGNTKRIDVYIPETRVLIEQKSLGVDLDQPQAGHGGQTPYEQALMYSDCLPLNEKPRFIVVSNFAEIRVYNMNDRVPAEGMQRLLLRELPDRMGLLSFLVNAQVREVTEEMELSLKAGELVGRIHDRFLEKYHDPMAVHTQRSLNILCVRLVFCLYAEDAGLFGASGDAFSRYVGQYEPKDIRRALIDLFKVLDTPEDEREDLYLSDELAAFPYVNGGLFQDENIVIPQITQQLKDIILESANFDWSRISPTIFGAVFESTLNPETRRSGGMHYTSIENIHKVIDPLFLDGLKAELDEIRGIQVESVRKNRLSVFQDKLASLRFLDPAAGSGNFLTETYLCLRKLENEAIELLYGKNGMLQIRMDVEGVTPIKVSITQFYGIEINDFAVAVAKTALWIAESQMMRQTEDIVHQALDFLPLKTQAGIVEGNALRMDWNRLVPREQLAYIMGNPPFVAKTGRQSAEGHHSAAIMTVDQKADKELFFGRNAGLLDYVACWYKKASEYTRGTNIVSAFVSTSSICQGQQVEPLWSVLLADGIHINFAYQSFKWETEASKGAYVYVVIVGFSHCDNGAAVLFSANSKHIVQTISPYLIEGEPVLISSRNKPISGVPEIGIGNKPIDGGNYLFKEAEMLEFIKSEPESEQYFHAWYGADEFINSRPRYCLWLGDCSPSELRRMPHCLERVQAVRDYRLASPSPGTQKIADKPTRFHVENLPKGNFIVIPEVSSGARRYIPIGYMDDSVMCSNKVRLMPNATLYHFGILTSNVHMSWMRTVGGYFGPSYQYSVNVVYNNFPWPTPTPEQKSRIEQTAQAILDARALYPDASLADLYDELTMPPELRKAHRDNDRAVMEAYGMDVRTTTESSCVAELMRRYQELTGN